MFTLHRYFIQADEMRKLFGGTLGKGTTLDDPEHLPQFVYMGLWYGSLYVVVEGWRKLKLSDMAIDSLLDSPYVDLLRKFRNGVFHYQSKYYDERLLGFMRKDTPGWVHDLHLQFGRYFQDWFAERRAERLGAESDGNPIA